MTESTNLRYVPGNKYVFLRLRFSKGAAFTLGGYNPAQDTLHRLDLYVMKCVEHHRVPEHFDVNDRLTCDGFIFEMVSTTDDNIKTGWRWNNQYPRASYSPTSDRNNYMLSPADVKIDPVLFCYIASIERPEDVTHALDELLMAIKVAESHNVRDEKYISSMRTFIDKVCSDVKTFTGADLVLEPLTFSNGETYPNITKHVLRWPVTEAV